MENLPKQNLEIKKPLELSSETLNEINNMCTDILNNWSAGLKEKEGINLTEGVLVNSDIKLRSSIIQKLKTLNSTQNQLYCYVFLTTLEEGIEQRGLYNKATEITKDYILKTKRDYRIPNAEEEIKKLRMAA